MTNEVKKNTRVISCKGWKKIVDDSKFIPMSELVKRSAQKTGTKVFSNQEINGYFDYPKGYKEGKTPKKDFGDTRNKDYHNMAVISTDIHRKSVELQKKIDEENDRKAVQARIEKERKERKAKIEAKKKLNN